jgi:hypothetical protein
VDVDSKYLNVAVNVTNVSTYTLPILPSLPSILLLLEDQVIVVSYVKLEVGKSKSEVTLLIDSNNESTSSFV